jgi:hypothetical protein
VRYSSVAQQRWSEDVGAATVRSVRVTTLFGLLLVSCAGEGATAAETATSATEPPTSVPISTSTTSAPPPAFRVVGDPLADGYEVIVVTEPRGWDAMRAASRVSVTGEVDLSREILVQVVGCDLTDVRLEDLDTTGRARRITSVFGGTCDGAVRIAIDRAAVADEVTIDGTTVNLDMGPVDDAGNASTPVAPVSDVAFWGEEAGVGGVLGTMQGCVVLFGAEANFTLPLWPAGTVVDQGGITTAAGTRIEFGDRVNGGGGYHGDPATLSFGAGCVERTGSSDLARIQVDPWPAGE